MKKLLLSFFLFTSTQFSFSQSGRLSEQAGAVKKTTVIPHGIAFELTNGYAEITAYSPSTVRVRAGRQKFAKDFSYAIDDLSSSYNFISSSTEGTKKILITDSLKVVVDLQPFRVSFYNLKNELLSGDEGNLGI